MWPLLPSVFSRQQSVVFIFWVRPKVWGDETISAILQDRANVNAYILSLLAHHVLLVNIPVFPDMSSVLD